MELMEQVPLMRSIEPNQCALQRWMEIQAHREASRVIRNRN